MAVRSRAALSLYLSVYLFIYLCVSLSVTYTPFAASLPQEDLGVLACAPLSVLCSFLLRGNMSLRKEEEGRKMAAGISLPGVPTLYSHVFFIFLSLDPVWSVSFHSLSLPAASVSPHALTVSPEGHLPPPISFSSSFGPHLPPYCYFLMLMRTLGLSSAGALAYQSFLVRFPDFMLWLYLFLCCPVTALFCFHPAAWLMCASHTVSFSVLQLLSLCSKLLQRNLPNVDPLVLIKFCFFSL